MGILPVEIELVADANWYTTSRNWIRRKLNERICQLYNKDVQDEIHYGFVQFQTRQREFVWILCILVVYFCMNIMYISCIFFASQYYIGRPGKGKPLEIHQLGLYGNTFCCGPTVIYSRPLLHGKNSFS